MHFIEPFFNWRGYYIASEDAISPFFEVDYSESHYTNKIYNFYIHPQWDNMGSETLFLKILFVDYESRSAVIEFIGEWNDAIGNDIMVLKREVVDVLINRGIDKFILIGENVLNFHYSDELSRINIDQYLVMGGELDDLEWRTFHPIQFVDKVTSIVRNRID